ncbi:MAG TPA: site-specific DNA-methyltransferase, partial [Steroidobacteraceae bacterium]
ARLALALQADGWFIRSEIVWSKPNPMPESCRDRPTSAHEKVYLLAKKPRYFYDADAVREPTDEPWRSTGRLEQRGSKDVVAGVNNGFGLDGIRPREYNPAGRNLRNVWTIATAPYAQAHFATFPPELAARCIRAGTSQAGCCAACGAPWVRQTDTSYAKLTGSSGRNDQTGSNNWDGGGYPRMDKHVTTTGWAPSCQCEAETRPCVVLDCFSGAGTALLVADRLGRDAIGIDLSHAYVEMTRERLTADCPLFMAFEPSPPPAEDPDDMRMADLFAEAAE